VDDGVIAKLDPNPLYPKSRGMLCAKGNAGIKVVYDPDRLKYPLIREGERGSGKWRRAGWDEALDYIAEKLTEIKEKYGPESVLFSSTEGFQEEFFISFAEAFGSPNMVRHPTLCLASVNNALFNTFGTTPAFDLKNARYVIIAGANRFESLLTPDSCDLIEGVATGKIHLIYLDPRYTKTASKAREYYAIRPGTDLAFILAMIHVLITEDLYDREFVETYCAGFEALKEHVLSHNYTPEWAAEECEIPAKDIRRIARDFASQAPRAVFYAGRRSSWYRNDTQMRRGIGIVNALVGNWDKEGGIVPKRKLEMGELLVFPPDEPEAERVDGLKKKYPLANQKDGVYSSLREAVLSGEPYPVKGWMIYKQDPLNGISESAKTIEMIKQMDLVVCIDIQPSDTAWMADVMLPEATYLERDDPLHGLPGIWPVIACRQKVIDPLFESKPNLWIMQQLAEKLDLGEYFDFTLEEMLEEQVDPLPVTLEEIRRLGFYADDRGAVYGKTLNPEYRFRTMSGKIELYATRYEEKGYDPLPVYSPPNAIAGDRFRLVTGRNAYYTHASLQNNIWLHQLCPENMIWIHPRRARSMGIGDGEMVTVKSPVGKVHLRTFLTEGIREDSVFFIHGFGHTSKGLKTAYGVGARDQDLHITSSDEISGNMAFHETWVSIQKGVV
jgi:thiosulfate reductase/polysulfide reductase chain A